MSHVKDDIFSSYFATIISRILNGLEIAAKNNFSIFDQPLTPVQPKTARKKNHGPCLICDVITSSYSRRF